MRFKRLVALAMVSVWGALLAASCAEGPTISEADGAVSPSLEPPSEPGASEPIGEARQEAGHTYESKDFPFVVERQDNGLDEGGGWQVARGIFPFGERNWLIPNYLWVCRLEIAMPLRTAKLGRISPSRAALYSAEVMNEMVDPLLARACRQTLPCSLGWSWRSDGRVAERLSCELPLDDYVSGREPRGSYERRMGATSAAPAAAEARRRATSARPPGHHQRDPVDPANGRSMARPSCALRQVGMPHRLLNS